MTKRDIIRCILAVVMLGYLVAVLPWVWHASANDNFKGLDIEVYDPDNVGFVDRGDIDRELGSLSKRITTLNRKTLSTKDLEDKLNSLDKVEHAECVVLSDGTLRIHVTPMRPVARVIDPRGLTPSYYVNREGKRMLADMSYRIDVPLVSGTFGSHIKAQEIMPLLDYIDSHAEIRDLVSSISINPRGDIIVVPAVSGHVINMGDTSDLENKWCRVLTFYRKVMPYKGWDYYDTLTVKWRGQLVASLHKVPEPPAPVPLVDDGAQEIDDAATMQTDSE